MTKIKLGVDAGHGLNTAGKRTPDGEREWTFNDAVLRAFIAELSLYEGVEIKRFDDPTGKTDVPLQTRTDGANAWKADYYMSFHHNALSAKWGDWTGVETYVYTNPGEKALALANAIHPAVVSAYGLRDRGVKRANLHIVRETKMPAILIEGGFMDSRIDIVKLRDKAVLEGAGKAIAQAFAKFAKLSKKVVVVAPVKAPAKPVVATKPTATTSAETYKVVKAIGGYKTAADAKARKNRATTVKAGTYYVYKKADGMYNVSSTQKTAGSWINPNDNKAVVSNAKVTHKVVKDDTLYAISKKYGVPVASIQALNGMGTKMTLTIGKVLTIKK